jgi:hypothetical protein
MHSEFIREDGLCQYVLDKLIGTAPIVYVVVVTEREVTEIHAAPLNHTFIWLGNLVSHILFQNFQTNEK